jgi:hypothetical protein
VGVITVPFHRDEELAEFDLDLRTEHGLAGALEGARDEGTWSRLATFYDRVAELVPTRPGDRSWCLAIAPRALESSRVRSEAASIRVWVARRPRRYPDAADERDQAQGAASRPRDQRSSRSTSRSKTPCPTGLGPEAGPSATCVQDSVRRPPTRLAHQPPTQPDALRLTN